MTTEQSEAVALLRSVLETRAESISSSVQMTHAAAASLNGNVASDLRRIREHAQEMYRRVRRELTPAHFASASKTFDEEMQFIRHELRGMLNTIVGLAQLIGLEEGLGDEILEEVQRIRASARCCVDALNGSRELLEQCETEDVVLHDRGSMPGADQLFAPVSRSLQTLPATILVVDDKDDSREQLQRFLEYCGHTVHLAQDGSSALVFLETHEVDLILLDLHMPGLNGFQVLERLRELGILRCTSVIIVSGMDFETHAVLGIEMGADDYLARPIDLSLLRARVNAALERQRLRERELAQYFTPGLARYLMRHPERLRTGRSVQVSVLFIDVVGFSRISERLGPASTIQWLGQAMEAFSVCIQKHSGVLVDYTGDQIMAIWGAPQDEPDHATMACKCALALWDCLPEFNRLWGDVIGAPTEVTIGINTGEAFVGNVGTQQKFKYGALGNTVNLASRLQTATKHVKAKVLISGETFARLSEPMVSRRLAKFRVNNIEQPVNIHELATSPPEQRAELYSEYEEALALFESGELHRAGALLGDMLKRYPDDGPSLLLLSRTVDAMLKTQDVYDPIWVLPGK